MALIEFQNEDKYFVKFFLLDASLNLNKWGVTKTALLKNLDTFIGKPFIVTEDYGHPNAASGDDLLTIQERFRVGDIISVGWDQEKQTAYGVAKINKTWAKEAIQNGDVNFVSPSIVFGTDDEVQRNGEAIIINFEGAHVAAVSEPAYGVLKAQIKGKCSGSENSCLPQLARVQASVERSPCGNYIQVKTGNHIIRFAGTECIEKCIQAKIDEGIEIDDQALAICYSECYPKQANIDQESLKNITKIDLIKKKKKADHTEVTMPRKRKGPVKTNAKKNQKEEDEDYELQEQSFSKKKGKSITSLKDKKSKKSNMRKGQEDENDKKKVEESDDEEEKEAQTLEDQLKDKEETDIMKGEDEDDDEEKDAQEDEDKKDADDPDKLDLTDKQKEFLKDSKLAKQIRILKSEVKALKAKARKAELEPIIDSIIDSKSKIGNVDARTEYQKLSKLSAETLHDLDASYKQVAEAKAQPRYATKYASVDSTLSGDKLFKQIRGEMI